MPKTIENNLGAQIIEKANGFGACLAGITNVEVIKESPSLYLYTRIEQIKGVGSREFACPVAKSN